MDPVSQAKVVKAFDQLPCQCGGTAKRVPAPADATATVLVFECSKCGERIELPINPNTSAASGQTS